MFSQTVADCCILQLRSKLLIPMYLVAVVFVVVVAVVIVVVVFVTVVVVVVCFYCVIGC